MIGLIGVSCHAIALSLDTRLPFNADRFHAGDLRADHQVNIIFDTIPGSLARTAGGKVNGLPGVRQERSSKALYMPAMTELLLLQGHDRMGRHLRIGRPATGGGREAQRPRERRSAATR